MASPETFTTNAMCRKNNCINPIFPAMEDMHRLESETWVCNSLRKAAPMMNFCRGAINYDPALPTPRQEDGVQSLAAMVRKQDSAASTMFFYHLSGLGYEAWNYQKPEHSEDDCVKSVWRTVCYTYFPRSEIGCKPGLPSTYLRPCKSCCQNYIRQCNVECCDESVACVFTHTKAITPTTAVTTKGYLPHDGPSSLCTGAATRAFGRPGGLLTVAVAAYAMLWGTSMFTDVARGLLHLLPAGIGRVSLRRRFFIGALVAVALSVQGCDFDVPSHTVGHWRAEPDYLISYEFIPPGGSPRNAMLNSCMLSRLSQTLQCNGRGVCKRWSDDLDNPTAFCECDRDWADPECRSRRKSQVTAFLLSLFFGFFGADHFYLGNTLEGVMKFVTFGGAGVWWAIDVIRIGSAPVQGGRFTTAADLPHWAFVLVTVSISVATGFIIAWYTSINHVKQRRKDAFLMQMEEEARMRPTDDGSRLAALVPPELQKPMSSEGAILNLQGRDHFGQPPDAPHWVTLGQQPPKMGAPWYGSTTDEGPPPLPSGSKPPQPAESAAAAGFGMPPVPSNLAPMQPASDPTLVPPGFFNFDNRGADLSGQARTEEMLSRGAGAPPTMPQSGRF